MIVFHGAGDVWLYYKSESAGLLSVQVSYQC